MQNTNGLNESLQKVVEKALKVAETTGQFVIEQAPDLINQFLQWHLFRNIIGILIAISIFLMGRYLPYLWLQKEYDKYDADQRFFNRFGDDGAIIGYVLFTVMTLFSFLMLYVKIMNIIKITVAPKIFIIEYFINN